MKKFLFKTLAFGLLAAILYLPALLIYASVAPKKVQKNMIYNRGGKGHLFTRLQEADTVKNVDILVIGSSHAYRGFDPRIFKEHGANIFVLGSTAQTPLQTEYLVNRYIDKIKPKLVIYEVYYATFGMDGTEGALDLFSNVGSIDYPLVNMAFTLNNIKAYNTLSYASMSNTLGISKKKESKIRDKDQYVPGGYVERLSSNKPYIAEMFKLEDITIDQNQLRSFLNICKTLDDRKIKTILIQAPISPTKLQSIANKSSLDSLYNTVKSAKYYDFNDANLFGQQYFFDSHHLNQEGVVLFDSLLLKKFDPITALFNSDQHFAYSQAKP